MYMRNTTVALLNLIPMVCLARTPLPYADYCAQLDRIGTAAQARNQATSAAVELLKLVALGRTADITPESETQVGLTPGELKQAPFTSPRVRGCAFDKIAETGLPEALDFLAKLKQADIGPDNSQQIWPAAQIALKTALLNGIGDPLSKMVFLEGVLMEPHDRFANSAVVSWAVNQLCDSGAITAVPEIQKSIRSRVSGNRAEDQIQFCTDDNESYVSRSRPRQGPWIGSVCEYSDG